MSKLGFFPRPVTGNDLYTFLYLATGENIPSTRVCPDHQTPWDLVYTAFFNKHPFILAVGPRSGSKTKSVAKIIFAEMFFVDDVEIASVGAVEKQAIRCYRYVKRFLESNCPEKVIKSLRSETELDNHSIYEQLVGTVNGVNSPHPHKLRADEVELMRKDVLDEMLLTPTSDKQKNIPANIILTSTRKYSYGAVQSIIDNKTGEILPIFWCYKEISEPCPLERRGSGRKKYVIPDIHAKKEDGSSPTIEIEAYSNCKKCPILPSCKGDLAKSCGYYSIDDLIRSFGNVSMQTWIQQIECRKASMIGKVYPSFDPTVHVGNFPHRKDLPIDLCMDMGFSEPACVGFWQEDEDTDDVFLIDSIYKGGLTTSELARAIHEKLKKFSRTSSDLRYGIGDSEQAQQIADLREYDIELEGINKGTISSGLDVVRRFLSSPDGVVRLHIHYTNREVIREFKNYHYKKGNNGKFSEVPVDKNNHALDMVRYYCIYVNRMSAPSIRTLDGVSW